MATVNVKPTTGCHVAAVPSPGRGHINPMMNICKQLVSRKKDLIVTFVVTEEWLGLIGSELNAKPPPDNIRFATVANVIPSEHDRGKDLAGFAEAVWTKLEAPIEELLDRLQPPVSAIVADSYLVWAIAIGNRRNIPVASLWPMSASMFSVLFHFELLRQNGHFPLQLSERGNEIIDYIPGISTRLADLPNELFNNNNQRSLERALKVASEVSKAQYLLSTSVYELESQVFDSLKAKLPFPVYPIGPSIPHFIFERSCSDHGCNDNAPEYLQWLDSQPKKSVLYVSFGSFLSVSSAQLDEITAGVRKSGTRHVWVARRDVSRIKDGCGDVGFVVPWCDQLRVLCHPSIGGFWTHCGWNSTLEAIFAGVPMLTCPILWDQIPNSKRIVEDWNIGYNVKKEIIMGNINIDQSLVRRDEIAELVKRFMDAESSEGKLMRKRVEELQQVCHQAISKGGSSDSNLDAFIENIISSHGGHGCR